MTNEIILTKSGISGEVKIFTTKVEEAVEKKLNFIRPPKSKQSWDEGPEIKIIDLLIVTRVFTIEGHLTETGSDTAQQQRDKLWSMIKAGGCAIMTYGGAKSIEGTNTFSINFQKTRISETPSDETVASQYSVTLSIVEGANR